MRGNEPTLADRLKSRRKELGLSQTALAASCGVSQPTIANWERGGHTPRQAALTAIALELKVEPVWLLSGLSPADQNPAHAHLAKPIRNIPIYPWPKHIDDLKNAQVLDYVTMSVAGGDILALAAPLGSDFPDGTILIFDRRTAHVTGRYLLQSEDEVRITDLVLAANDDPSVFATHQPIARLILSLHPH